MKWKIIADSGCDYRSLDNLAPDTECSFDYPSGRDHLQG